jgi:hypothetical protein
MFVSACVCTSIYTFNVMYVLCCALVKIIQVFIETLYIFMRV